MANQYKNQTVTNLGTTTLNILSTDTYTVAISLQIPNVVPTATQGAGAGAGTGTGGGTQIASQVVTTIKQNGTTIGTSAAGQKGYILSGIACTAGDVITVTLSSSLSQDQQPNAVQATISLSEGPA
jgi:hypothetical protein